MPPSRVCDVPIGHLHFIWPRARGLLVKALDRGGGGRYAPADILALLLAGAARLWVSYDPDKKCIEAAILTQTIQHPQLKELHIWLVGGSNMKAWAEEARDMIEAFARADGCAIISGGLRRGWIRIGGEGWHETGATFEKRLDGDAQ